MTPGMVIGGKYRLQHPLGEGVMGVVWAAVNELTDKEVALKLLQGQNPELRKRLLREAKACGRLSHPNIVEIYDVGETSEGDPFLVMELLNGETLADLLGRESKLAPATAVRIAVDVARALRVAHNAGVIHRDLKPANIFLAQVQVDAAKVVTRVKVLDFGVSKLAIENDACSTAAGSLLGSPAYMSPEQAQGLPIDARADLWALGVVLFQMLAGVRPFQSRTLTGVITEILSSPIPRVESLAPVVDCALGDVIAHCLERDIERRVRTAEALSALLRPFTTPREVPQRITDRGTIVIPRAQSPSAPEIQAQGGAPAAATVPLAKSGVSPEPTARTVEWPAPPMAAPGPEAISSTTPVSRGAHPVPQPEATLAGPRPKRGSALLLTLGVLATFIIVAVVFIIRMKRHESDSASAPPTSMEAQVSPPTEPPQPVVASIASSPLLAGVDGTAAPPVSPPRPSSNAAGRSPSAVDEPTGPASSSAFAGPADGTLNINAIPLSKVLLDGKPLGDTPKIGLSVRPGTHTVTFISPQKERKTVTIQIKSGETKVAAVKFDQKLP